MLFVVSPHPNFHFLKYVEFEYPHTVYEAPTSMLDRVYMMATYLNNEIHI